MLVEMGLLVNRESRHVNDANEVSWVQVKTSTVRCNPITSYRKNKIGRNDSIKTSVGKDDITRENAGWESETRTTH